MSVKKVLFLTGTRADFSKLKALIAAAKEMPGLEYGIFATGMHMLARYGLTVNEIYKSGFDRVYPFINQDSAVSNQMDLVLGNTIQGLGHYVREFNPDMIVVHGDRVETLAGAIVGAINNRLVAHIEGGEVSGTIDELIRHAVSKLSHLHFVANEAAAARLLQMGEAAECIFTIGSPDIDVMLSDSLPSLDDVRSKYEISFADYGILVYHPVTTELSRTRAHVTEVLEAVRRSDWNWVALYPNNDAGGEVVLDALERMPIQPRLRLLPSMRFEHFLTLLKNARAIIGNSSAGIREAPVYGVPTINIGSRQSNRSTYAGIVNVAEDATLILDALRKLPRRVASNLQFGTGQSARLFCECLRRVELWETPRQKQFRDVGAPSVA